MKFRIRTAKREELNIPIEWAAKEGWNPGLYDADAFYRTDPKGFLLGFLEDQPIASISAVAYDNKFAFLGFYIVSPEYRGLGYGIRIWNKALKRLPTQNIGLDGVVKQQGSYKKSGFKFAYRNIRYEGKGLNKVDNDSHVIMLTKLPLEEIASYDVHIFPANRQAFIKTWIKQPENLAIGYLSDGKLQGYGMARKCRTGFKVGPLFADNAHIADALFQKMRSFIGESESIFLDVPEPNKAAVDMAESVKMKPMFETARMYTIKEPEVPLDKVFGVTSFELG